MNSQRINILSVSLVLIVGVVGLHFLLRPLAPRSVESEIYAVKFLDDTDHKRYQIQGDQLTCEPGANVLTVDCTTTFEGQPLQVSVRYQGLDHTFANACWVEYAGAAVACQSAWDYEHRSPSVIIRDDLDVSAARFAELRSPNPLLYWSEGTWMQLTLSVAVLLALATMIWLWLGFSAQRGPAPIALRLLLSIYATLLMWLTLTWSLNWAVGLVIRGPESMAWQAVVPYLALIGSAVTFGWQWQRLGGWQPPLGWGRLVHSLAGGLMMFMAVHIMLLGNLLFLGFVD